MSKKVLLVILCLSVSLGLLFCVSPAYAVFNLTATPSDGGFDLRFPKLLSSDFKQTKEVTLRITSDLGKQYRITQQVIKPLATFDGTPIPDDQFKMYPLVNSNSKGTLLYREEAPVGDYDTTLYTSNGTGENDSFKLVYTLSPSEKQVPGSYYGRIAYILTPIDSTQAQVVVTLNIYADLGAGNAPVVEVTTGSGMRRLNLSSKGMGPKKDSFSKGNPQISVKIHGPLGSTYRIYEGLEGNALMSGSGEEFDLSKVLFSVNGGDKGTATREGDFKAAMTKQLLYVSDPNGSPDEFVITYKPSKDFRLQKAGLYKGKLNLIIEKGGINNIRPETFETLDTEIEIVPLFDMMIYSGGQEGVNLKFGNVSYKSGTKTFDVEIFVESNAGKSYQVVQKTAGPMANEYLDKIREEDFTLKVKDVEVQEEPRSYLKEASAVKEGDTVIFSSGPSGESCHFKVEYQLIMHPDTKAGNYSTKIGYSLALN